MNIAHLRKMDVFSCRTWQNVLWILLTLFECARASYFKEFTRKALPPRFHPTPNNVTYEKGHLATLQCSVENLGTKTVIWRKQPYNVPITVGLEQFLEINRFYLSHVPQRDTWDLLIKNVQPFDSGTYECQIASTEKLLRRNITLHVVEGDGDNRSAITITGTRFVEKGNSIFLTCNASGAGSSSPPRDIEWFKDGNKLNTRQRSDISIDKKISYSMNTLISKVTIYNAHMSDTGTYVCRTSELQTESFKVDVLNAETNNVKREYEELSERNYPHRNVYSGQTGSFTSHLYHILLTVLLSYIIKDQR